ncbi:MAG: sulfatase [Pirellulales bacterium]
MCRSVMALCQFLVVFSSVALAAEKPNIVIINVDDLGYADIGPFGSTKNRTPNLDRMAAEGKRLTSFYAAPVCSPSRAALMTGCYPKRVLPIPHVLFPVSAVGLAPEEITIAELLRDAGYATACIGKWHLGDQPAFLPTAQGFETYYGIPYSNDMGPVADGARSDLGSPIPKPRRRPDGTVFSEFGETGIRGYGQPPLPMLENDRVAFRVGPTQQQETVAGYTDRAVDFIKANQERSFFLYLPHSAVHFPIYPGEAFAGRSPHGYYSDWVEEVDWSVGRVLDAIRTAGLAERTLVVFTSDNGGTRRGSNVPLRGHKGSTWEGGVRSCTIAWWPGSIPADSASDVICGMHDILPTAAALSGVELSAGRLIDGRDLSQVLKAPNNSAAGPHESFFYFRGLNLQAVRQGRWKLHLDEKTLYDLAEDIGEQNNLASQHPEIVSQLNQLAADVDADLGRTEIGPGCRPLGRVAKPKPWIPLQRDGLSTRVSGNGD